MRLGLRVLAEQRLGGASRWEPYLRVLPRAYDSHLLFFSKAAMDVLLPFGGFHRRAEEDERHLRKILGEDMSAAVRAHPSEPPFAGAGAPSRAELARAVSAALSRAFNVDRAGGDRHMLPYVDFASHSSDPNAVLQREAAGSPGAVQLVARRDTAEGEPVEVSYGELKNDDLLADYSFVVADNPHDRITVPLTDAVLAFGRHQHVDVEGLVKMGLFKEGDKPLVHMGGPDPIDGRLLAAFRLVHTRCMPMFPTADWLQAVQRLQGDPILGWDVEKWAAISLMEFCTAMQLMTLGIGPQSVGCVQTRDQAPDVRLSWDFRHSKVKTLSRAMGYLKVRLEEVVRNH